MSQNIVINGVTYNSVSSIEAPLSAGGGNAVFPDTSSGDAAAGDIASGKIAWVDGVEITGTGAGGELVLELIESITVPAGGLASIIRDEEPDETPYAFKEVWVSIYAPTAAAYANTVVYFINGSTTIINPSLGGLPNTSARLGLCWCGLYGDIAWRGGYVYPSASRYSSASVMENITNLTVSDYSLITKIQLAVSGGNVLPENSTVKIFGRR